MITDTYGRTWRYTPHPDHDLSQALQISQRVAEFILQTDLKFNGIGYDRSGDWLDAEHCLIKQPYGEWELVSRVGNRPLDFYVISDIEPRIIALAFDMHRKEIGTPAKAKAFDALVPDEMTVDEAWAEYITTRPDLDGKGNYSLFVAGYNARSNK